MKICIIEGKLIRIPKGLDNETKSIFEMTKELKFNYPGGTIICTGCYKLFTGNRSILNTPHGVPASDGSYLACSSECGRAVQLRKQTFMNVNINKPPVRVTKEYLWISYCPLLYPLLLLLLSYLAEEVRLARPQARSLRGESVASSMPPPRAMTSLARPPPSSQSANSNCEGVPPPRPCHPLPSRSLAQATPRVWGDTGAEALVVWRAKACSTQ